MNSKLLSYSDLKEELKYLEKTQTWYKLERKTHKYLKHRKYQKKVHENKIKINIILSAIHHAKDSRKFYNYKKLYEKEKMKDWYWDEEWLEREDN